MLTRGSTTTVVLLACLQMALGQAPTDPTTPPTTWKKNCFSETESSNNCNGNTIKILSDYYTCELAIEMDNIPEEIAYLHGTILVAAGGETFVIRNEQLELIAGNTPVPPSWNDFTDNNDNRFYLNEDGTLVTENQARSDIEILTTGEITKQIVLDVEQNKLIILAYNQGDSAGSLFAFNTNSLNSVGDDKVEATKIEEAGEDISAFAVESGAAKLLLGLRTEKGGGKIIRLSRQGENPCQETDVGKKAIMHIIEETKDKISKTLEDILIERTALQINEMELQQKIKDLSQDVLILRNRLEGTHIPHIVNSGRSPLQCVSMNDYENLKTKFFEKENAITELRRQLDLQTTTPCIQTIHYPYFSIPPFPRK